MGRVWARRLAVCVAIVVGLTVVAAAQAIPLGVYGNTDRFDRLTGQETDSGETYLAWDQGRTWGSPYSYFLGSLRERPHITLKTAKGGGITPQGIARGKGDAHLIGLALAIAEAAKPVYIRPLAEMNNERNPYCAFYANGRPKGGGRTAAWYRKAFQRIYILMHGGTAKAMSARLRALGMPGVKTDVPVNRHHRTEELYKAYRTKPFMFSEWGLTIDDPSFIKAFAGFVRTHRRVRFISFFNGPAGERYDLGTKPKSRAAYRRFIVPLSG